MVQKQNNLLSNQLRAYIMNTKIRLLQEFPILAPF
jgi:hypothetical protein